MVSEFLGGDIETVWIAGRRAKYEKLAVDHSLLVNLAEL
jgi:hypothetical protein